jgi:hypothetical protein
MIATLVIGLLFLVLWVWGLVLVAFYAKRREDNTRQGGG